MQGQSGTGKTATFSISILQRINTKLNELQAIVLSPTRELAHQSAKVLNCLGNYLQVKVHLSVGGVKRRDEMAVLRNDTPHVIVATPGRLWYNIKDGIINVNNVTMLVVDEADEMLDKGFLEDFKEILKTMPFDIQIVLLSATMPEEVLKLTENFMMNPRKILVKTEEVTLEGIAQYYVNIEEWEKHRTLSDLYANLSVTQSVIFVNKRRTADWLREYLTDKNHTVSMLHSGMEMDERNLVMKEFRTGSSRVLITTDILARGIDVQQVSLVVNFDLPLKRESYVHRFALFSLEYKKL